jgi:hypothetical protein
VLAHLKKTMKTCSMHQTVSLECFFFLQPIHLHFMTNYKISISFSHVLHCVVLLVDFLAVSQYDRVLGIDSDFAKKSVFVQVWFGLVWFGLVWFGLVWIGLGFLPKKRGEICVDCLELIKSLCLPFFFVIVSLVTQRSLNFFYFRNRAASGHLPPLHRDTNATMDETHFQALSSPNPVRPNSLCSFHPTCQSPLTKHTNSTVLWQASRR